MATMNFAYHHRKIGIARGAIVNVIVVLPAHLSVGMTQLLQGHLQKKETHVLSFKLIQFVWL